MAFIPPLRAFKLARSSPAEDDFVKKAFADKHRGHSEGFAHSKRPIPKATARRTTTETDPFAPVVRV